MNNIGLKLDNILLCSKKICFPAFVLCAFLMYFFSITNFSDDVYHSIHATFIVVSIINLILSGYFRVLSVFTISATIYVSYLVINSLRYAYGEDYIFSAGYNIWNMVIPLNIVLAYWMFACKKKKIQGSCFFVVLFLETMLIEKMQSQAIAPDSYYFYKHIGTLNYPAFSIYIVLIILMLMHHSSKGRILSGGIFFTIISLFVANLLSDNLFAFSLFYLCSTLILTVSFVSHILYNNVNNEELDVANYYSFCRDAEKKYPLKYSVSLMYIDEYERILKRFGYARMISLKKMFFKRIKEINPDVMLYNYKKDALIMVFKNANATDSFDKADEIRRQLVKSIFVFNENNHLQLTVSQCISEKKRSDNDATVVLFRAEASLKNACKFTRNITIKA